MPKINLDDENERLAFMEENRHKSKQSKLMQYCIYAEAAKVQRHAGMIQQAIKFEAICDGIYRQLPKSKQW